MQNLIDLNYGMNIKEFDSKEAIEYRKRLSEVSKMIDDDLDRHKSYEDKFLDLCTDKQIENLKRYYNGHNFVSKIKSKILLQNKKILDKIYKKSISEAQFEVFKWLKSIGYEYELNAIDFYKVIEKGNYDMAKYLYNEDNKILNKEIKNDFAAQFLNDKDYNIYELSAVINMEKRQNYNFMKFFSEISNYDLQKEGNLYKLIKKDK
jgi:hypothetical protein